MRAIAARFARRSAADIISASWRRLGAAVAPISSRAAAAAAAVEEGDGGVPHVPVLIVGAGPVGLVLTMLLTKLGIKCAVLEKSTIFSHHPQAHFINNRTMEIFRKLDGLAEDIELLQPTVDLWRKFIYCTSLSGSTLGEVDHMQPQDFDKIISPVSVAHYSQYKLIDLLLEKLENIGVRVCSPHSIEGSNQDWPLENKILMGHECTSIHPSNGGVIVSASFSSEGKIKERRFQCSFLLGSDGARSTVRKLVNISMKGERDLQKLISVHFMSTDLGQFLLNQRPGMLFFIFNPDAIGVLVAHDLKQGEFVLQIPYYPPQQKFEDFSSKVCEQIIFKLVGWEPMDIKVMDIKPWVMHAEVAEKYVAFNNRVVLVGDAAHRFPPAGGFGMNTGIAIFNTALSLENFKAAMSIPAALGLDPTVANTVHNIINSSLGFILPRSLQKAILEGIFSIGRAQVSDYLLNEKNPLGSLRLAKLKKIFDEGKSLQLQFPAEDLGFCYQEGALIPEVGHTTRETQTTDGFRRLSREYIPSAKPGSRLPHMPVRALTAPSNEDTFSTLDLVSGCELEFLLIIAPLKESYNLARAILEVSKEFRARVKVCILWPQGSFQTKVTGSGQALEPWMNHIDVEEACKPSMKSWWETCGMTSKGVLLVRPDEHIAWRAESHTVGDAFSAARRIFSRILCYKATSA